MKWDLDETFLLNGGRPSLWQCPRPELFVKTKVTLPLFFGSIVQDFLHWYTEKKLLFLIRITIIAIYNDKFLKKSLPRLKHEVGLRVHTQLPAWNWIENIIVKNLVNSSKKDLNFLIHVWKCLKPLLQIKNKKPRRIFIFFMFPLNTKKKISNFLLLLPLMKKKMFQDYELGHKKVKKKILDILPTTEVLWRNSIVGVFLY